MGRPAKRRYFFSDISVINTLYVGTNYHYTAEFITGVIQKVLTFSHIAEMSEEVINDALASPWKDKEDAVLYYSAVASMADYIITRNKKDFHLSSVPVLTPDEFIKNVH